MPITYRRLLSLAALALAATASSAVAQEALDPVISKLDQEVSSFLESISKYDEERAFDHLLIGSKLREQTDAVQQMVAKAEQIERSYGKHQETERISAKRVGKDLVVLKYLFKCKDFPVVWYFTYYRDFSRAALASDVNNWIVIGVRFNTELESLASDER